MSVKKEYSPGDPVWIHGVTIKNNLTQGKVISTIDLSNQGYTDVHYVIEIPTGIDPLLEIRTWHTMSQDNKGPVGSLRNLGEILYSDNKKIKQLGYTFEPTDLEDDPTPDEIMAALEKSADGLTHKPLHIKENKPKRKYYPRKKK